jgi:hypothetical protein
MTLEQPNEFEEWQWFLAGLARGFDAVVTKKFYVSKAPLQTHPELLRERRTMKPLQPTVKETSKAIPAQRRIWKSLIRAKNASQVQAACKRSRFWLNDDNEVENLRISVNLDRLHRMAPIWLAAKSDKKFPKSDRPTSEDKQIEFLARAMAGGSMGLTARYANEKLRKRKPAEK